METADVSELPNGWEWVRFEEVAEINPRKAVELGLSEEVTFVPMVAVDEISGTIDERYTRPLHEVNRGYKQFAENDILFAKITPSMENGKAAVATGLVNGIGFGSTEFHVLRSRGAVLPRYLWRFVRQQSFREKAKTVMSGAVGQQRVPASYLKAQSLPLPPLREQRRIVERIDSLIARVERTRAALDQIPALARHYQSLMLTLAFDGALTAESREGRPEQSEGESGYPTGWVVKTLGELGEIRGGIQVGRKRSETANMVELRYLRVANVQRGWLDLDEVKTIAVTPAERHRLLLQAGDILMNEGGDRDKLGRGWIWEGEIPECIHQNHVFRVRLRDSSFPPKFVSHYANAKGQEYFIEKGTQTTNLASIGKGKLDALPIPVPPTEEAKEIVDRLESMLDWVDKVLTRREEAKEYLVRLEAAILGSGFRGELSFRDPNDEPIKVLLSRSVSDYDKAAKSKRRIRAVKPQEITGMARSIEDVLSELADWLPAQEVFRRCGITDGSETDEVEALYSELRQLDKAGRLLVEAVTDDQGRKAYDRLKLQGPSAS